MSKSYSYKYLDKKTNIKSYITNTLRKTNVMFKYHNLPDTIPQYILESMLQQNGFVAFASVEGDLYCFVGGLGGELDAYYQPTICTISNPALNFSKDLIIDADCVIVSNDSYKQGLIPLIEQYAMMLVENDISMIIASINTRITTIFSGGDATTKQSAEEYLKNIINGKLGVITDNTFLDSLKINPASTSHIDAINSLITQNQYIKACLLNEIGLSANTQLKKERLISAEIENSLENLYPIIDDMLNSRRLGIEKVNKMFGTNIQVELNSSWDLRALNGMSIHNIKDEITLNEINKESVGTDDAEELVGTDDIEELDGVEDVEELADVDNAEDNEKEG